MMMIQKTNNCPAPFARPGCRLLLILVAVVGLLAGCDPDDPSPAELTRTGELPAGSEACPRGGVEIAIGIDDDGDGVLDDSEVDSVELRCERPVLVREDDIAPGDVCSRGGVTVHIGADRDGDGILADDEIEQTEIICIKVEVVRGDVHIDVATDLRTLAGVRVIHGNLYLSAPGALAAPSLELLTGDVWFSDRVQEVNLPALSRIGGNLTVARAPDLRTLDMPALRRIDGNLTISLDTVLSSLAGLDRLEAIGGGISIHDSDGFASMSLPALEELGALSAFYNDGLEVIELPRVSELSSVFLYQNNGLRSVELESLDRVRGDFKAFSNDGLETLAVPGLATVLGELKITGNQDLAEFRTDTALSVGALTIRDNAALSSLSLAFERVANGLLLIRDLPALESLDLSVQTASTVAVDANPLLRTLTLSVGSANRIDIDDCPALETLNLRGLWSVNELRIQRAGIRELAFPNNGRIRSDLWLIELPALTNIGRLGDSRNLQVLWLKDLPALPDVGVHFGLERVAVLTLDRLDSLQSLAGFNRVEVGSLSVSKVPKLTSLEGVVAARTMQQLALSDNESLADISTVRQLSAVERGLDIQRNAALDDLDALTNLRVVGGSLRIVDNPTLASAQGLGGLDVVGETFVADGNPLITDCQFRDLVAGVEMGSVRIQDNGRCE